SGLALPQLLGDQYNFLSELEKHHRFEDLFAWVTRLSDTLTEAVSITQHLKSTRYLAGVIDYIHDQYATLLTLETAASRIPISPHYLSHLFRDELGMTFLEYVTRVRMEKARELLRTTTLHIREIASHVGYEDAGYFTRVFRKINGISPNRYRSG
ncbi:MAG: helix-turn-helix domain-containing protein, partial [Bacteroidales bacterium]|nr:helix-turn-helix domain-containing protein [Bacteroidales bacterium]